MYQNVRYRRSWIRRLALPAAAFIALGAVATVTPSATAEAAAKRPKLLIRYQTKAACLVVPNYPKEGVVGNHGGYWIIPAGRTIIWRYNVNATWAVVSDPARAKNTFAWWGFAPRACIGKSIAQSEYPAGISVPSRILEGRSQLPSGWRKVDFRQSGAGIIAHHVQVKHNGTMRDPANFVVGNVYKGWHVHLTGVTRGNGWWILVYVPNAKRWGYIESRKLR